MAQPKLSAYAAPLVPPINFAMVAPGIYRSGFPTERNVPFLERLGLRTIISLSPERYGSAFLLWASTHSIDLVSLSIPAIREPWDMISGDQVTQILETLLNTSHHPCLIHCNKGKHRTGCVVGCLRRLQRWSLAVIFNEYSRFADTKGRFLDLQFIELFDLSHVTVHLASLPSWLEPS